MRRKSFTLANMDLTFARNMPIVKSNKIVNMLCYVHGIFTDCINVLTISMQKCKALCETVTRI